MNNCRLEIYENNAWVDYTKYMVASFKYANLLDEQLDEASITQNKVPNKAYFKPMTRIRVVITNSPLAIYSQKMADKIRLESDLNFKLVDGEYKSYDERTTFYYDTNTKRITITSIKEFLLANDTSIENPVSSNLFNHEIYLIEQTKYLERFIGDSITFTNALGKDFGGSGFAKCDGRMIYTQENDEQGIVVDYDKTISFASAIFPSVFQTNETIKLLSFDEIRKEVLPNEPYWGFPQNDQFLVKETVTLKDTVLNQEIVLDNDFMLKNARSSIYNITYNFYIVKSGLGVYITEKLTLEYTFSILNNKLPLKKWTITDVINRIFDTIEPLVDDDKFKNNKPRFRLRQDQAEKYDKILAPEFAFTQMSLREMLSQVGGFIHAEPRITRKIETAEEEYWEVVFDEYGSNELSHISQKPFISAGYKTNVNDYCTSLDSSAQNLVNIIDYAEGAVFEPFYTEQESGKGITFRAETTTMRIEENDSTFIPTTFKNYMFKGNNQVVITYIPTLGNGFWDITPYIFEKDDYYGVLDSFAGEYPYSKSYALYYTQGTQNIYGLFFKAPHRTSEALEDYAILKIIRAVTGRDLDLALDQLNKVRFRISYLPITNARVRTAKQNVLGGLPSTIAYNQGANLMEGNFYGEQLKGVVSRLGNVEKTYTYHLAFLSDVPKVGTLFDKDYYISSVSTEILPLYIRCTIGLSKDFNRLSEYVGISSNKRMWEVSKDMVQERQSVYTEYLVIKRKDDTNFENGHWRDYNLSFWFFDEGNVKKRKPANLVEVVAKDKQKRTISTVCLPVIGMALGNSILLTFGFQDNYSAGQKVEEKRWTNHIPYADFYGRLHWLDLTFSCGEPKLEEDKGNEEDANTIAKNFPLVNLVNSEVGDNYGDVNTEQPISIKNYLYRKDNRETPQITYELCAVVEDEDLIIGSALMQNCKLVNRNPVNETYLVYGFTEYLNKYESKIDVSKGELIGNLNVGNTSITLPKYNGTTQFKSWAIVTPSNSVSDEYEDEDGNITTQNIEKGSELVLGGNSEYVSNQRFGFDIKGIRDIYQI